MTIDQNTLRRLNKLWKDRHGHDTDTTAAELVEIRETISVGSSGATVSPAYIHLTHNSGQTIAVSGEAISWDAQHSLIDPVGFANPADAGTDNLPLTTVVVPYDGYYGVKVELKWDSHTAGGTVEIRRTRNSNAVRVWPTADDPGIWTATDGQTFSDIAIVPAVVGDLLSVYVDHDAGAGKDLDTAQVIFYKVESSTAVRPFYKAAVLAAGPLAYWRLDDTSGTTAVDITGNGYDGTYVAGPTLEADGVMVDGSGNPSVDFDGSTQYVTVDDIADGLAAQGELTIEVWVNADAFVGSVFTINRDFAATVGDNVYGITIIADGAVSWADQNDNLNTATGLIALDTAHYVVVTRDSSDDVRIYVDGVWVKTGSTAGTTALATDLAQLGMDWDDLGGTPTKSQFFNGQLDEIAVYTRVLDPDEILEHYNVGRRAFL